MDLWYNIENIWEYYMMMRYVIISLASMVYLFGWSLQGFRGDVNVSDMQLSSSDVLWAYQDGKWATTQNISAFEQLHSLKGGEGFWSKNELSLSQPSPHKSISLKPGWNLITPVYNEWNLSQRFDANSSVNFIWGYENGWKLYSKKDDNYGYTKFDTLSLGEGGWLYYTPAASLYFGSIPIYCKEGNCTTLKTNDSSFLFKIKCDTFGSDLKVGMDLYRYSNDTHYKFAFGPFQISQNSSLLSPSPIPVCVDKEGTNSCKKVASSEKFAYYKDGYIVIDSQKIASLFDKSIPSTKESFKLKLYISGFLADGFIDSDDFGTIGIENFGTWVTIKNDKAVSFDIDMR